MTRPAIVRPSAPETRTTQSVDLNQALRKISSVPAKRSCAKVQTVEPMLDESDDAPASGGFISARSQYIVDQKKKLGKNYNPSTDPLPLPFPFTLVR